MRILWMVGLVVWSCCFALGFNYGHGDSLVISIILLVSVLGIMGTDIFFLNRWTDPHGGENKKDASVKEMACLVVYVVMLLLTIGGVARFVTVQTEIKSKVRTEALSRIEELRAVFGNEDCEGSYQSYVTEISATYRNEMKKDYADEKTVNIAVAEFEDAMMGEGSYERLRNQAKAFLAECEYSILNWIPWNVTEYLRALDSNLSEWETELVSLSKKNDWVKATGDVYDPHLNIIAPLAPQVTDSKISNYGLLSIVLILVMQVLILFPYVKGKDWSKSGPIKHKSTTGGPVVYGRNGRINSANRSNKSFEADDDEMLEELKY